MGIARELEEVGRALASVTTQNDLTDFLNDPGNVQRLNGLVEDIRYALMNYQVCIPKSPALTTSNICLRLHCNGTSMTKSVGL